MLLALLLFDPEAAILLVGAAIRVLEQVLAAAVAADLVGRAVAAAFAAVLAAADADVDAPGAIGLEEAARLTRRAGWVADGIALLALAIDAALVRRALVSALAAVVWIAVEVDAVVAAAVEVEGWALAIAVDALQAARAIPDSPATPAVDPSRLGDCPGRESEGRGQRSRGGAEAGERLATAKELRPATPAGAPLKPRFDPLSRPPWRARARAARSRAPARRGASRSRGPRRERARDPRFGINENRGRRPHRAVGVGDLALALVEDVAAPVLVGPVGAVVLALDHGDRGLVGVGALPARDVGRERHARPAVGIAEDEERQGAPERGASGG